MPISKYAGYKTNAVSACTAQLLDSLACFTPTPTEKTEKLCRTLDFNVTEYLYRLL